MAVSPKKMLSGGMRMSKGSMPRRWAGAIVEIEMVEWTLTRAGVEVGSVPHSICIAPRTAMAMPSETIESVTRPVLRSRSRS